VIFSFTNNFLALFISKSNLRKNIMTSKLKDIHAGWPELFFILLLFAGCSSRPMQDPVNPSRQWPGFRGKYAAGVLDDAGLPESWDVESMQHVKWKTEVPGLGLSCPVIWGDRVYITTAVSSGDNGEIKTGIFGDVGSVNDSSVHEWKVLCYNKNNGRLEWERTACRGVPQVKRHPKSTHANSTAVTDGRHLVVFFGSEGLYCYDMDGHLEWGKDFGILRSVFFAANSAEWEFASSPILYENVVIVQCDVLDNSFVAALDADTGDELWKVPREDYPGWATPNIYLDQGQARVVVNGYRHIGAYDFKTGREIWRMSGGGDIPIPTPVIGEDLVYFNSAHGRQSPIFAVRKNAEGNITPASNETSNEFVAWSLPRDGAYMQTMILYEGLLYCCKWNGTITCYDAFTGEAAYREKLGDVKSFTASPVISDGRLFIPDDEGSVYIIQTGRDFKLLDTLPLGDVCMATPALSDGMMVFRTQSQLIAIGD
jgi:outer membrane protein assembly factor BamB